jgi:hypothetical protein
MLRALEKIFFLALTRLSFTKKMLKTTKSMVKTTRSTVTITKTLFLATHKFFSLPVSLLRAAENIWTGFAPKVQLLLIAQSFAIQLVYVSSSSSPDSNSVERIQ